MTTVTPNQIACPHFPYGTPVDSYGCPGALCQYYGRCPHTLQL